MLEKGLPGCHKAIISYSRVIPGDRFPDSGSKQIIRGIRGMKPYRMLENSKKGEDQANYNRDQYQNQYHHHYLKKAVE